jgi:hypothetical protein
MTTLSVALAWIAISTAGAKGLVVFARAAATSDSDDLAACAGKGDPRHGDYPSEAPARRLAMRP